MRREQRTGQRPESCTRRYVITSTASTLRPAPAPTPRPALLDALGVAARENGLELVLVDHSNGGSET